MVPVLLFHHPLSDRRDGRTADHLCITRSHRKDRTLFTANAESSECLFPLSLCSHRDHGIIHPLLPAIVLLHVGTEKEIPGRRGSHICGCKEDKIMSQSVHRLLHDGDLHSLLNHCASFCKDIITKLLLCYQSGKHAHKQCFYFLDFPHE